jgi:Protein of unknown function (DUF3037)
VPEMSFSYAILRVVPSVERGESINVGVVMHSRQHDDFLGLRVRLDDARLAALAPGCDPEPIRSRLTALDLVASGAEEGGALAKLPASDRFGWLTSPSSTVIQPSDVHTGLTADPAATLDHLFDTMVA